ncbi:MAG: hypothetical protein RBR81_03460 [Bacteroidales bacterium]|nr:hypothetical protein [Bacteroidales bacterium]
MKRILVPDYGEIIRNPVQPEDKSMTPELVVTLDINSGDRF